MTSTAADWAEFAENVRRTRLSSRPATGNRWLGVAGMFALLGLFAWLVWALVLHRRLEVLRPGANIGVVQGNSAGVESGAKPEPAPAGR
jgi:hypothetical protein